MTTAVAWQPEAITAGSARLSSALAALIAEPAGFAVGSAEWTVAVTRTSFAPTVAHHIVTGTCGAATFVATIPDTLMAQIDRILPPLPDTLTPDDHVHLIEHMFAASLMRLADFLHPGGGHPVFVSGVHAGRIGARPGDATASVTVTVEPGCAFVVGVVADAAMLALIEAGRRRYRRSLLDLRQRGQIVIGQGMFALGDLTTLAVGDIVFPDRVAPGTPEIRFGALRIPATLNDATADGAPPRLIADRPLTLARNEWDMMPDDRSASGSDATPESAAGDDIVAAIGEIPIRVWFSAGEVVLPTSELATLVPGHVFDTGVQLSDGITVWANGIKIGIGEIVSIEHRLGVRMTRVADHG